MLNLLNNWKLYLLALALIGALSLNVVQHIQRLNTENNLAICQGNLSANNVAIQAAHEMQIQQEKHLRLREQEAANARAGSLKRMETILTSDVPDDSESVNDWLIDTALGFHWTNNIPY